MSEGSLNRGVIRSMRILKILKGHSLTGLALREISKELKETDSTVLRTLEAMAAEDVTCKLDTGRWALGITCLQIAASHDAEINRGTTRINELAQRVRAGAAN